jgi:DGQHR domain-containing protein
LKFDALEITQGKKQFYVFRCKASELWKFARINQRIEDKDEGYQRVLSPSRVRQLKQFIMAGNAVPGAIIISFDAAKFANKTIEFDETKVAGWIMDGQHRAAAAHEAALEKYDIELPVVAFIGLSVEQQTDYFVTINREAKSVPSSLYIDLLKNLPKQKTEKELLEERVADISRAVNQDPDSPLFQRVVSTVSPKAGQISLTNFARIIRPHINPNSGILATYNLNEQQKILENYIAGFKSEFPKQFARNIFFKTLGFGAIFKAFPVVFSNSLRLSKSFRVSDVQAILSNVGDFDFDSWSRIGTGSQAERIAADDFITELKKSLESQGETSITLS